MSSSLQQLRFSAWALTASSILALSLSDFSLLSSPSTATITSTTDDYADIDLLLFVLGACALTWASPLAQLGGTWTKPGFQLVNLFGGGTSTIVLQAFAWACYGVAVFGCVVALVNPQVNLRGVKTGLGLFGLASQTLIEMSIGVFERVGGDEENNKKPGVKLTLSRILLTLISSSFALAAFAATIAADWLHLPFLPVVWNLAFALYVVSFALSQFGLGISLKREEEARMLARVFAFLMLGCTTWFFIRMHALAELCASIHGSTFALGLLGFLTSALSLYSQWMMPEPLSALAKPPPPSVAEEHSAPKRSTSKVYYASVACALFALAAAKSPLQQQQHGGAALGVALSLLGCVLAYIGTWHTHRSAGMKLIGPLQGGIAFVIMQGFAWMCFAIALSSILLVGLNSNTLTWDGVSKSYLFSLTLLSHICLLASLPMYKHEQQHDAAENEAMGTQFWLVCFLVGSLVVQGFAFLPSTGMALGAAFVYVDAHHQFAWTGIVALTMVQFTLVTLRASCDHHQAIIGLVAASSFCSVVRAGVIFWYSKVKPVESIELQLDLAEQRRLAALAQRDGVRNLLLRKPHWLADNRLACFQFLCIHLVLFCYTFASPQAYLAGVLASPCCALHMEYNQLGAMRFRQRLHPMHVTGWFIIGIALLLQGISGLHAQHHTRVLIACLSYLGLMLLFSIDSCEEEEEKKATSRAAASHKRKTVSWMLNIAALAIFLGIDAHLLLHNGTQHIAILPIIASAWLAIALSVPLAYFTTGTSVHFGLTRVLGVAIWTFSLFLILVLVGRSASESVLVRSTLAYSQTGLASLFAQTLLSRGDLLFISQFLAMACSLVFLYMFLPSLRWFLDYPMWYYAYYFKSWTHSVSPDGLHPYKDVVVLRNLKFLHNGEMDVMAPKTAQADESDDGKTATPPPIVFLHGGAHLFCLREIFIHSMTPFSRAGLTLYAVEYPLSPEAKFPRALITTLFALNDLYLNHCRTGCCLRGEPPKVCNECTSNSNINSSSICKCCKHYRGTDQVQLLGDSAGGNLAALVCAVLCNADLFRAVFEPCAEFEELRALALPSVARLGLIYALLGKEVRDAEDEAASHWNRIVGAVTARGLDFLLALYASEQQPTPTPTPAPQPVFLNDFLQHEPSLVRAFAPETLMIVGTRDPLLYPNRLACALLRERFPASKVELMEIPGSFHGFHGLPPQWNMRWKRDALPATQALIKLFTGDLRGCAEADFDKISRDYSPLLVLPALFFAMYWLASRALLLLSGWW